MKFAITALAALATAVIAYLVLTSGDGDTPDAGQKSAKAMVQIELPVGLSEIAKTGKSKFEANCAGCHGVNAVGRAGVAPPLIHKIYEPSHHGDESFQRAVAMGAPSHHWKFGNMPPVKGLDRSDVAEIVQYIRELQQANNIR